jgi:LuxR family maltose regulon positive regulatory protein
MREILLQTKLNIPPLRPSLVPRPGLVEKLNAGLGADDGLFSAKLTLASASAGFGKTTLISSWIRQLGQPSTWLSLGKEDNEPDLFLAYLIAALQKIDGGLGETAVSLLHSPQDLPPETLLTVLINDLAALPEKAILVLDDYHLIQNRSIHTALTFFLDNLPPQLHLVIISREDPPLPLHRLRVSGEMTGIYAQDLRFSADEAGRFLNGTMGLRLTQDQVATLERRTEGWVAGLQLAALSLQDLPDVRESVTSLAGDDRYVADYLLHEVLERQPVHIQEFLLQTAVLDRLCPSLCDAVIEAPRHDSQSILAHLEASNLFIIPLDNKREWYRYHHLFADFLRVRLRGNPDHQMVDLHRRASLWFEANGLLVEALEHALSAKEFQRAASLVDEGAETALWRLGKWSTLLRWTEALPEEVICAHPRLSLYHAWALFTTGQWERVAEILPSVEEALATVPETAVRDDMLGEIETIRACVIYEIGDMAQSIELARRALDLLAIDNHQTRGATHFVLGLAYAGRGDWAAARQAYQKAIAASQLTGNLAITLMAMGSLMQLMVGQGQLQASAELYLRARQLAEREGGVILGPAGVAFVEMGEVLREWNDLEEAERILRKGIELCQQQKSMPEVVLEGTITLARVLLARGAVQSASEEMQRAENLLRELWGRSGNVQHIVSVASGYRARYWLAQGNMAALRRCLAEDDITSDGVDRSRDVTAYLLLARQLLAQSRLDEAADLLQRLDSVAKGAQVDRSVIEIRILQALVCQAQADQPRAESALAEALQMAESEGYVRLFIEQGEPMARFLKTGARYGVAPAYINHLLAALHEAGVSRDRGSAQTSSLTASTPIEPLKERELQVLRLISAGLSNREIAAELYLSVNTIKAYSSRIYGKLSVHNRAEAVDRAHELGIL